MQRAVVIQRLAAYASGQLSREDFVGWITPIYTDDSLFPDEGTESEPWLSSDDEASLLLWLIHVADMGEGAEEEKRRDIARALACYYAVGAEETLVLMRLLFDQDRLCDILAKMEQGIISRTGFLLVLSKASYDKSIKRWLTETTPEGLRYLRRLLVEESYDEVMALLRPRATSNPR